MTEMMFTVNTVPPPQAEVVHLSAALTQRLACAVLSEGEQERLLQCAQKTLPVLLWRLQMHSKGVFRLYVLEQYVHLHVLKLDGYKLLCFSPVCCFKYCGSTNTCTCTHTRAFSLSFTALLTLYLWLLLYYTIFSLYVHLISHCSTLIPSL